MQIKAMRVRWWLGWGNSPIFEVLVDRLPHRDTLRFRKNDAGLYLAEEGGYVQFYAWSGKGNDGGYSNAHIPITMIDGSEVVLLGPWSARAGVINRYPRDFPQVLDVSITDERRVFDRGYTFYTAAVTKAAIVEALPLCPGVTLHEDRRHGDVCFDPTLVGMTPEESKRHLAAQQQPRKRVGAY